MSLISRPWSANTVYTILSQERLKFYRGLDDKGSQGNCDSLLSENDYNSILEIRFNNKSKSINVVTSCREKYLLTGVGILNCGYCKGKVKASIAGKGNKKAYYYLCTTKQMHGVNACKDSKLISMPMLDEIVIKDLFSKLSPSSIENIVNYIAIIRAQKLDEISLKPRRAFANLSDKITIAPDEAFKEYQSNLSSIEQLWNEYKNIGVPSADKTFYKQELILQNISNLELKTDSLTIIFKFPITSDLSFKILYKL